jgi:AraC-type DNA-binding domain-containing proteins
MSRFFDAQYAIAAQEIVRKHYNTKITTARIAMEVGVSERTLKRAFKNHFHIGIYEFQLKLRMEKAKELLECGGCTIKKVAWQVGYKRQSAFARRFKEYYGVSALRWRR